MGRNKRKSKAAARVASDSDEENDETATPREDTVGETPAAAVDAHDSDQHSGHKSDHEDGRDSDVSPERKNYKDNHLNKRGRKGKKGNDNDAVADRDERAEDVAVDKQEGEAEPQDTRIPPVEVLYCPNCTFPAEYCEFGGMMDKCRPWLLEHAAELAEAEDHGRKRRILTEKDRLEAMLAGRGVKKALERIVVIELEKRVGKRMITSVFGMDLFGFNLKDLSREWRKRFACGSGVRSAAEGKCQDCIDVQGNVVDDLAEMLASKYSIPKSAVFMMEGKKRVPYPY